MKKNWPQIGAVFSDAPGIRSWCHVGMALLVALVLTFLLPTTSLAASGDWLWDDYYDREGPPKKDDRAHAVAVSGRKVFVAGETEAAAGPDFSVRAYNAKDGSLLWWDYYDRTGKWYDRAYAVATAGKMVFAVGTSYSDGSDPNPPGCGLNFDFTVRAYDGVDGTLLWDDEYHRGDNDVAYAATVLGKTLFVAGKTQECSGDRYFTVRAYNTKDGTLLWQNEYNTGVAYAAGEAHAVAAKGGRVFVAGTTGQSATSGKAFTVRAFDAKTGALLWWDYYDGDSSVDHDDEAYGVAVAGNRVIVVGKTWHAGGGDAFTVRTYDAEDGTLLWDNYYDGEADDHLDAAYGVAVSGAKVFVVGQTWTTGGGPAFTIRTYNVKNGELLWWDYYNREGNSEDIARAVTVLGRGVYVAGRTFKHSESGGDENFAVRAYNAKDGSLMWGNYYNGSAGLVDDALAIAAAAGRVFAAGETSETAGADLAFSVRAFAK